MKRGEGELVGECSDIDDIIVIRKDGIMQVSKVSQKAFFGKDIIHVAVWKRGDERTVYNCIYLDGATGRSMMKRFNVPAITRDREYNITKGTPKSRILYFSQPQRRGRDCDGIPAGQCAAEEAEARR